VASGESVNVPYGGPPLARGSNYHWRVRTWGSAGVVSPWSAPQAFTIEPTLPPANARSIRNSSANQWSGRYQPAFDTSVAPASFVDKGGGNYFIDFGRDVVVFTSRKLVPGAGAAASLAIGNQVSDALVELLRGIEVPPRYLIAKGGITSSNLATRGLGVKRALVLGQILPGVPVWKLGPETRFPGLPYIVFPGNVGGPDALAEVVRKCNASVVP